MYRDRWWHYAEKRPDLYATIAGMGRVLVAPRVSKYPIFVWREPDIVTSEQTIVIAESGSRWLAVCQSSVHGTWTLMMQSSLETRGRYTPSDCFETFPFPRFPPPESRSPHPDSSLSPLESLGERYYQHRQSIMATRQEGLTKTYNRFHNPAETSPDIAELRRLHVEMDHAVAAAYGWHDLIRDAGEERGAGCGARGAGGEERKCIGERVTRTEERKNAFFPLLAPRLDHGFHKTKQGLRYTISEAARREVLDRLLELNHQRYAEEVAERLHEKKASKPTAAKRSPKPAPTGAKPQTDLFGHADDRGAGSGERGVGEEEQGADGSAFPVSRSSRPAPRK